MSAAIAISLPTLTFLHQTNRIFEANGALALWQLVFFASQCWDRKRVRFSVIETDILQVRRIF